MIMGTGAGAMREKNRWPSGGGSPGQRLMKARHGAGAPILCIRYVPLGGGGGC